MWYSSRRIKLEQAHLTLSARPTHEEHLEVGLDTRVSGIVFDGGSYGAGVLSDGPPPPESGACPNGQLLNATGGRDGEDVAQAGPQDDDLGAHAGLGGGPVAERGDFTAGTGLAGGERGGRAVGAFGHRGGNEFFGFDFGQASEIVVVLVLRGGFTAA